MMYFNSCTDDVPKYGYCPICDELMFFDAGGALVNCPKCGHHLNLHDQDEEEYMSE